MPADPTCPDCDGATTETEHRTSDRGDGIRVGESSGLLGTLDLKGSYLTCYVRPECGLARFYAE